MTTGTLANEQLRAYAGLLNSRIADQRVSALKIQLETLDYHGIALLAQVAGSIPQALAKQLNARKAMMIANEALKLPALIQLSAALKKAHLRPIVFKGTALAYAVYPHPWLRPRTDTDLFCDHGLLPDLEDVLLELGYEKLFAISGEYVSYQATYAKALTNKVALNIDLHWRINNRQILARSFSHTELLSRAQPISSEIPDLLRPSAVDSLLLAAMHRLGHHHREERLTWLYDIHLLAEQLDDESWQELTSRAIEKELAAVTLNALRTSQELFATNVPQLTIDSLANKTAGEQSAIFLQRDLTEWRLFFHELNALPTTTAKYRWISENLFPNADYTREQMGEPNLLIAHSKRIWRGLKRLRQ